MSKVGNFSCVWGRPLSKKILLRENKSSPRKKIFVEKENISGENFTDFGFSCYLDNTRKYFVQNIGDKKKDISVGDEPGTLKWNSSTAIRSCSVRSK